MTRARDLGIPFGRFETGEHNAITDVRGVRVGHCTLIEGEGAHAVRTGVTAVLPNAGDVFMDRVVGGGFVLNGAGEVAGLTQVLEWGLLESPILLTNTLSVGACSDYMLRSLLERYPSIGREHDVVIPVVGECDDSHLNDIAGRHVQSEHVVAALRDARGGPVPEGNVGGGTGMVCCDFKGGIGTSSRVLPENEGGFTLGCLVMTNFGLRNDLRLGGYPVGAHLEKKLAGWPKRTQDYGSIIVVLATDAPLSSHQLSRLSRRSALGVGRAGSYAAHGSGEIVVAFSTANTVPREGRERVYGIRLLADPNLDPLYEAAVDATEEAIANALCAAEDMVGVHGRQIRALPLDEVRAWLEGKPGVVERR